MPTDALTILEKAGGFATTAQLLTVMTRQQLDVQVKNGGLVRVWYGVYAAQEPDLLGRLAALDVFMGGTPSRVWAPPPRCMDSTRKTPSLSICSIPE
ncbi:hypothetical protein RN10_2400 [Mycobacterium tuberculosis]|nr:hypothetical protein RN03_2471 [Mycobacterium tuberculosis]AMC55667.1 hypothetical protein RN07_2436 [Mycobacterium tuberculosis variant bovis]AMC64514.1 hypothetical protein RN09_2766 [Mycobacterium tuberculosis variant africanum]AMC68946.1 hypothetical protein RN10_2400 [Mycobacterium tuberculosis]